MITSCPDSVHCEWEQDLRVRGKVCATSKSGIRDMGEWMREHEPDIAEVFARLGARFGIEKMCYLQGPQREELREHMQARADQRRRGGIDEVKKVLDESD